MTKERTLLFTDREKQLELQNDCEAVKSGCNNLIRIFEQSQPWQRITTLELWLQLVDDPVNLYDSSLIEHSQIKAEGVSPDPAVIANLFGIDRAGFVKKATNSITYSKYRQFERFMLFQNGGFTLNEQAIEVKRKSIIFMPKTEKQIALKKHFDDLFLILQEHYKLGFLKGNYEKDLHLTGGFIKMVDYTLYQDRQPSERKF